MSIFPELPTPEVEEKVVENKKKVGLFDFVNDLSSNKKYLFDDDIQSVYNNYMVNKAFAQHLDTIMYANELNKRPNISKLLHHDFLFYGVDSNKRYGKWAKAGKLNDAVIDYLKERYCINNERALEYIDLLSTEQIKTIETSLKTKVGRK